MLVILVITCVRPVIDIVGKGKYTCLSVSEVTLEKLTLVSGKIGLVDIHLMTVLKKMEVIQSDLNGVTEWSGEIYSFNYFLSPWFHHIIPRYPEKWSLSENMMRVIYGEFYVTFVVILIELLKQSSPVIWDMRRSCDVMLMNFLKYLQWKCTHEKGLKVLRFLAM